MSHSGLPWGAIRRFPALLPALLPIHFLGMLGASTPTSVPSYSWWPRSEKSNTNHQQTLTLAPVERTEELEWSPELPAGPSINPFISALASRVPGDGGGAFGGLRALAIYQWLFTKKSAIYQSKMLPDTTSLACTS